MKNIVLGAVLALISASSAFALDEKAYVGTWTGQLASGEALYMNIPAGVTSGAAVSYSYKNQDQGPQIPTVKGNKIRLDNPSGTYILVGPPKGNKLPYFWTDGTRKASAIISRQ